MIFESVWAMTVIDLMIIAVVIAIVAGILRNWKQLKSHHIFPALFMMLLGLGIFGAHSLIDLLAMYALPVLMGRDSAMEFMEALRLEASWLVSLGGVVSISIGMLGVVTNVLRSNHVLESEISSRTQAEVDLREREQQLSEILNLSMDAVISMDQDQRIILFNGGAERIFGYASQEVIGHPLDILLPEATREIHRHHLKNFSQDPQKFRPMGERTEVSGLRKNGEVFPAEASISKLYLKDKIVFTVYLRDITLRIQAEEERKKLELGIQQTQRLESLGVLAGGIAHDFNNLLLGIMGNSELAKDLLSRSSPALENLEGIDRAARQAADLCRQMLAYSGKGRFIIEAFNLNELVEDMAHLMEASISKTAILKFSFADNLPAITGDVTQIRQVILNLIVNASEAIGEKSGVINFATSAIDCNRKYLSETFLDDELAEGLYVSLEVSDTGQGMDEETMGKIFDPFFSTKFTGRGLGLAALLGIVRGHKGAVRVYSELNRGTTFKLLFPASEKAAVPLAEQAEERSDWKGSGTVLIIDDEETIRAVTKQMLEMMGFSVLTANDGRAGLVVYQDRMDDIVCVLLDLTMPHMGGEETLRQLRQIRGKISVILSSGYNEQEVMERFSGKQVTGFIQKPYSSSTLKEKLRDVLG